MKICIYGSASDKIDKDYIDKTYDLSVSLGERGHSLVFGAGRCGLMGAAARGFKKAGGFVFGVIPKFFEEKEFESIYRECDKLVYTETMEERKAIMENECDAFIITPGGIGTFDELFQILTLKQLDRHKKAIVVYNVNDYYSAFDTFMDEIIEKGFVNSACKKIYKVCDNIDDVISYLENYTTDGVEWEKLKRMEDGR